MMTGEMTQTKAPEAPTPVRTAVQSWVATIIDAKNHWKDDFDRMRSNIDFANGYQWNGQQKMETQKYVANVVLRVINQKVAALYARNPKAVGHVRKRKYYQLWDGKLETLALALQNAVAGDMEAMAVLEDYTQGEHQKELLTNIVESLELMYDWNVDRQEPEFKTQMKQLVWRTLVCGVGYVDQDFQRPEEEPLSSEIPTDTILKQRAQEIRVRIASGELDLDSPEVVALQSMVASVTGSPMETEEKLVFDFPSATSVIPDKATRMLKGFVGGSWVAVEYCVNLTEANAFFGVQMQSGKNVPLFDADGSTSGEIENAHVFNWESLLFNTEPETKQRVRVWKVYNKRDRTRFFVGEGWDDYLLPPEPISPKLQKFWPITTLIFNHVERDNDTKATPFPPSDVDLLRHVQKEWNRSRDEMRAHRRSNRPKYVTSKGWLTPADKEKLANPPSSAVLELEGVPKDADINKLLVAFKHAPLEPALYDTAPLMQDMLLTVGMQEANVGPTSGGDTTATESSIAEQSRMSASQSNVDDLDDFLSVLARNGGEILLGEADIEHVAQVVGPGMSWPTTDQDLFAKEVFIEVEAASSGRPNKAVEIANFERLAPFLMQSGADPMALISEMIKRLDDRLDPQDFRPSPLPAGPVTGPQPISQGKAGEQKQLTQGQAVQGQGQPQGAEQPLPSLPSEAPVPMAAG